MISPRTKTRVFKALSVVLFISLFLVTCEAVFYILLKQGISWPQHTPTHSPSTTPSSNPPLATELAASSPHPLYSAIAIAPTDPQAPFPINHIDINEDELNMPLKNFSGTLIKRRPSDGTTIYSVDVVTDSLGRRLAPVPSGPVDSHAVVMGCSYAFGETVRGHETLGAYLQVQNPGVISYNLAFSGYGPNDILARTAGHGFMNHILPSRGTAFYLYTDNQIKRVIGAMSVIGHWGHKTAAVETDEDSSYRVLGKHLSAYPLRTLFLRYLWTSSLIQFFHIDWPFWLTEKHYDEMARQFKALEREYKSRTAADNEFIVVIYPETLTETNSTILKAALHRRGLQFIDYSSYHMAVRIPEKANVDYDGHPTPAAYRHLAELLTKDVLHRSR